jgi:hypothetical protein
MGSGIVPEVGALAHAQLNWLNRQHHNQHFRRKQWVRAIKNSWNPLRAEEGLGGWWPAVGRGYSLEADRAG